MDKEVKSVFCILIGSLIMFIALNCILMACFKDTTTELNFLTQTSLNYLNSSFHVSGYSSSYSIGTNFSLDSCAVFKVKMNNKMQTIYQGAGLFDVADKKITCRNGFIWLYEDDSIRLCYADLMPYIKDLLPYYVDESGNDFTFWIHTIFYPNGNIKKTSFPVYLNKKINLRTYGLHTFYESGNIKSFQRLADDKKNSAIFNGITCSGNFGSIHFYENGSLKSCALSESHNFYGYELPQFTQIWLFDDHSLESFYANTPISIQDISCGVGFVFLHPNGNLKSCLLETSQVIQTVSYEAGDEVCFDSEGVAVDCS